MSMTKGQVGLLAGFAALAPLAIDMYLPALPPLAADLGASVEQAGSSVSVFLIGIAGGQLVAGPLSDRLGRKPLFLTGLVLFALSATVAALTTSFAVLLVARLLQAFGACSAMVSGRAIVRDRLDATESAKFFSLLALVGGMAPVLGSASAGSGAGISKTRPGSAVGVLIHVSGGMLWPGQRGAGQMPRVSVWRARAA